MNLLCALCLSVSARLPYILAYKLQNLQQHFDLNVGGATLRGSYNEEFFQLPKYEKHTVSDVPVTNAAVPTPSNIHCRITVAYLCRALYD